MITLLVAVAALAGEPAATPSATPVKPKKEAKICRTQEITGTRMGGRTVCKTADEWRLEKDDAERMLSGRRDTFDTAPARPPGL